MTSAAEVIRHFLSLSAAPPFTWTTRRIWCRVSTRRNHSNSGVLKLKHIHVDWAKQLILHNVPVVTSVRGLILPVLVYISAVVSVTEQCFFFLFTDSNKRWTWDQSEGDSTPETSTLLLCIFYISVTQSNQWTRLNFFTVTHPDISGSGFATKIQNILCANVGLSSSD